MLSSTDMADPSSREVSTSGTAAYIEHTVSRLDTLAGIAIKYGVEVADIKRFNGLTTDLQMFALKTLRIPTPGRHPPSAAFTGPTQSRCKEKFAPNAGLDRDGSQDLSLLSTVEQKAKKKAYDTPTMDVLRNYYDLPSTSTGVMDGLEMATFSSGNETDLDDEVFLLMFRPPNATDSRRYSTGDYRPNRCGYVRDSCRNLLDSCWSAHAPKLTESTRLLKPGKNLVREGDSLTQERPIRRRTRGELGSDDTADVNERLNYSKRDSATRPKDSNTVSPYARFVNHSIDWHNANEEPFGSSSIKTIRAALVGGKEVVEGLLSKVIQTSGPTASQEGGRSLSERVPSTGSFSVLEGITSVYRQAKAALD